MNVQIFEQFHGIGVYHYRCDWTGWHDLCVMDDFGNSLALNVNTALYSLT